MQSLFQKRFIAFIQKLHGTYSLILEDMNAIFGALECSRVGDYHYVLVIPKY